MRKIISRNPFSGQITQQIPFPNIHQLRSQLTIAEEGYELHSKRQAKEKFDMIAELIPLLQTKKTEIAKTITFETGKPITEAESEVNHAIRICEYYSKLKSALLPIHLKTEAKKKSHIKFNPLGTVLVILPSQYPLLLNLYKTLPQLLMGNGVMVRHAHNTPKVANFIDKIMNKVGFQSGQYQLTWNSHDQLPQILQHKQIIGVSFTGSTENASTVASLAGKYLKRCHLSPSFDSKMIVMQDGNVEEAVGNLLKPDLFHSGQGITPKKILIHQSHYDRFKTFLIEKLKKTKIGDPLSSETTIGPLASPSHQEKLKAQLSELPPSSQIIFQRQNIDFPFFPPTIIQAFEQLSLNIYEGPVFQVCKFKTDLSCVRMINESRNSSAAYIFSSQKWQTLDNLQAGSIFVNGVSYYDPHAPLGQLNSQGSLDGWHSSVRHFCNSKLCLIN